MLALLDIESWLKSGGLALLAVMVFAESGMLVGFFLPGDSLLFIAGFLASDAGDHKLPALPWVALTVFAAAVAGDQVGYLIGRRLGPSIFDRPDSKFLRPSHVTKAHAFFERHGAKTVVLARFVPIVRTFTAVVAGAGRMTYRKYLTFDLIGGLLWGVGMTTLGYYLGQRKVVKDNLEIAVLAVVVISLLPVAVEFVRHRKAARAAFEAAAAAAVDAEAPDGTPLP